MSGKPNKDIAAVPRAGDFPGLHAVSCYSGPDDAVAAMRSHRSQQIERIADHFMMDQRLAPFMNEHRGALLRYLRARGAEDADDLVQEIWLRFSQVDMRKIEEPRAYLYRIAHNLMLDQAREKRRRTTRERMFQDIYVGEANRSRDVDAERTLIEREHLSRIDRALAECGARTDMIFRRHRVDRVPQRDLALEFGVSLSAIEKQLQKAYRAVAAAERDYQAARAGQEDDGDGRH